MGRQEPRPLRIQNCLRRQPINWILSRLWQPILPGQVRTQLQTEATVNSPQEKSQEKVREITQEKNQEIKRRRKNQSPRHQKNLNQSRCQKSQRRIPQKDHRLISLMMYINSSFYNFSHNHLSPSWFSYIKPSYLKVNCAHSEKTALKWIWPFWLIKPNHFPGYFYNWLMDSL